MDPDLRRTLEFEDKVAAAASTVVKDIGVGTLFVNSELPGVWDRNYVRLDERSRDKSARELAGLTDELLGALGADHRKIYVASDFVSEETLADFKQLGWARTDLATMVLRDLADPPADLEVEEVDTPSYEPFEAACVDESPAMEQRVRDQLVSLVPLMARAAGARFFVARRDGKMVSGGHLYSDGEVAQIEDVMTLDPYRRRGLAGAVVARAAREALDAGHSLVFLIAENEGSAKSLYVKLGFEEVGGSIELAIDPS